MNTHSAAGADDIVTLTHADDNGALIAKNLSTAIDEAINANANGGLIDVIDSHNKGTMVGLGVTRMIITLA